ncbi:MAG: DUF1653 domain-containing protein [Paludibacteraceae bacterium]|nr:DUF1653 domain-containing protein [Paludibacteraceae bacterium]
MKTILFLHGFFASGQCVPANALRDVFGETVRVLTPDLPIHPKEALELIHKICDKENPDLIIGNSCGSFYAQMIAPVVGIPALLGNPYFKMTEFLVERVGNHQYKSPRVDGKQDFTIDENLIKEFAEIENEQFNFTSPFYKDKIWGIFGDNDPIAHFEPTFLEHYDKSHHFPGAHTPTADEVKEYYVPLAKKMLEKFPKKETRFFQHFKGGKYRFVRTAFDSESQERMVVYQALYGDENYWVRPEKMFFETVEREGKRFPRFTEIEM